MDSAKRVIVTTSWDDGHPIDLKLANLLSDLGINGTFYVSPNNRERTKIEAKHLKELAEYFEIGAHTRSHIRLPELSDKDLEEEIHGSKMDLENIIGKSISMFCYPWGRHNKRVRRVVINAKFIGARTDQEYYLNIKEDPWQMPTTIQAFPHPSFIRIRHCIRTRNLKGLNGLLRVGIIKSWGNLACALFIE